MASSRIQLPMYGQVLARCLMKKSINTVRIIGKSILSKRHCEDQSSLNSFAKARAVALPLTAEMVGQEHPCSADVYSIAILSS